MTETAVLESPRPSIAELQRRLATELSLRTRLVYTCLLLVDLGVGGAVASLWLTEPSLPLRTHLAFGAIVVIALAWAAYFTWTLTKRKVLLARHRLVAGRLAVAFSALYTAFALGLAVLEPAMRAPATGAAAFGLALMTLAAWMLGRSKRRVDELRDRQQSLERQLAAG